MTQVVLKTRPKDYYQSQQDGRELKLVLVGTGTETILEQALCSFCARKAQVGQDISAMLEWEREANLPSKSELPDANL